jgi:hypothetical protein
MRNAAFASEEFRNILWSKRCGVLMPGDRPSGPMQADLKNRSQNDDDL